MIIVGQRGPETSQEATATAKWELAVASWQWRWGWPSSGSGESKGQILEVNQETDLADGLDVGRGVETSWLGNTRAMLGEGSGTPLRYSCLENPMDGGAW